MDWIVSASARDLEKDRQTNLPTVNGNTNQTKKAQENNLFSSCTRANTLNASQHSGYPYLTQKRKLSSRSPAHAYNSKGWLGSTGRTSQTELLCFRKFWPYFGDQSMVSFSLVYPHHFNCIFLYQKILGKGDQQQYTSRKERITLTLNKIPKANQPGSRYTNDTPLQQ